MTKNAQELATALLKADTESEVIAILDRAGYWGNEAVWRDYGDMSNNSGIIGSQAATPVSALAEKLTNAFDAVLFNAARMQGLSMHGMDAPQNVPQAVQILATGKPIDRSISEITDLPAHVRHEWAEKIAIAVTGSKTNPSVSIVDQGEGQTPANMPHTFLSLATKRNKVDIPFAHGLFNLGGSAALKFSSPEHKFQLILTRRNPELLDSTTVKPQDLEWGFTIVRLEGPERRNCTYSYLAPVGIGEDAKAHEGGILSFSAEQLQLMPNQKDPYHRPATYGTMIKLYEYQWSGRNDVLQWRGLIAKLELALPNPALPFRVFECRDFDVDRASSLEFRGAVRRLMDNSSARLQIPPVAFTFSVHGEEFKVVAYATTQKDPSYLSGYTAGVLYTVNGQTHGSHDRRFFDQGDIPFAYLKDYLHVVVDCDRVSLPGKRTLFRSSRDGLQESQFRSDLEEELAKELASKQPFKDLNAKLRRLDLEGRHSRKDIAEAIQEDLKKVADLTMFLQPGHRLNNPLAPKQPDNVPPFIGKYFPTFFVPAVERRRGFDGTERVTAPNARLRWTFNTDAQDDYFTRSENQGSCKIVISAGNNSASESVKPSRFLYNGECNISFEVPKELQQYQALNVVFSFTDVQRSEPFTHVAQLSLRAQKPRPEPINPPDPPEPPRPPKPKLPKTKLALPESRLVYKDEWSNFGFNGETALRIKRQDTGDGYDFYINADNTYLLQHIIKFKLNADTARRDFGFFLINLGMGMITDDKEQFRSAAEEITTEQNVVSLEDKIEQAARAAARFLMPTLHIITNRRADDEPSRRVLDQSVQKQILSFGIGTA